MQNNFTITKKIAKQGTNTIIIIPKSLQDYLTANTLVKLEIEIIPGAKNVTNMD